nr:MAG TPA: hypothetical protein [Caudoviricetes sp.]
MNCLTNRNALSSLTFPVIRGVGLVYLVEYSDNSARGVENFLTEVKIQNECF